MNEREREARGKYVAAVEELRRAREERDAWNRSFKDLESKDEPTRDRVRNARTNVDIALRELADAVEATDTTPNA